jgi:DNA-binding NtrC family response regulator
MNHTERPSAEILIVDDEPDILFSSKLVLRGSGFENVHTVEDSRVVLPFLEAHQGVSLVILDLFMPHITGLELLPLITCQFPHIQIIVVTAANEIATAIECIKKGASDYLVKPVDKDRFLLSITRALDVFDLKNEVTALKEYLLADSLKHEDLFSSIITKNQKMRAIFQYIEAIAGTKEPVLVTGETGVGKELIAKAIHGLSARRGPFVATNVSGLDDHMFSDSLFGHKRGAYTGAEQARDGLILQSFGGTLFLDEIGDMSEASQVKLLRVLQEKEFYPLGSDIPKKANTRMVVATNRDLQSLIAGGKFRSDLYFRLRTHQITIPALRDRREDIPLLLDYFLEGASRELRKKQPSYPRELVTLLANYSFPGNVRELRSMVFDAVARHRSGILSLESFREKIGEEFLTSMSGNPEDSPVFDVTKRFPTLKETEEYLINEALRLSSNNQGIAASLLGITRQALNKRLLRQSEKKG